MNVHSEVLSRPEFTGGVCEHSMPNYFSEYVIFCVGNDVLKEQQFMSWALRAGVGYKAMMGRYGGITERSFMIAMDDAHECWPWFKNEESVLVLGAHEPFRYGMRPAHLLYIKDGAWGAREDLGFFHAVGHDEAMAADAYTFDISSGLYWIARPKDSRTHKRNRS